MISVIMPAYNAAAYISQAIASVLNQTYQELELLIIDDGSRDETERIIQQFSQQDSRIRAIKNAENLGVAKTRNRGISLAKGEWIAFLDSDDIWRADKLEKQLEAAEQLHAAFLFTGSAFVDDKGNHLEHYLSVPSRITYRELLKQNIISCSSVLIRKELILAYPMEHADEMHEDFAVWLQILRDHNMTAVGVDEPLLIYRISSNSKSGNKIKAALMTYRVYQYLKLPLFCRMFYWSCYVSRNLKKYLHLRHAY